MSIQPGASTRPRPSISSAPAPVTSPTLDDPVAVDRDVGLVARGAGAVDHGRAAHDESWAGAIKLASLCAEKNFQITSLALICWVVSPRRGIGIDPGQVWPPPSMM